MSGSAAAAAPPPPPPRPPLPAESPPPRPTRAGHRSLRAARPRADPRPGLCASRSPTPPNGAQLHLPPAPGVVPVPRRSPRPAPAHHGPVGSAPRIPTPGRALGKGDPLVPNTPRVSVRATLWNAMESSEESRLPRFSVTNAFLLLIIASL